MTETKDLSLETGNKVLDLLVKGNLNWQVEKLPLISPDGYGMNRSYGLFTNHTKEWLGTTGEQYVPVQNYELAECIMVAAERLGMNGNINASALGYRKVTTYEGKKKIITRVPSPNRIYIQIELDKTNVGKDKLQRYLSVLDHKDGRGSIGVGTTNVTIICMNTFNRVFRDLSKIYHTESAIDRVDAAMKALEGSLIAEDQVMLKFKDMVNIPYSDNDMDALTVKLFGQREVTDETSTRKANQLEAWENMVESNLSLHGNNRWGLFSAVTDWTNHVMTVNAKGEQKHDLMDYVTAGLGAQWNNKAFELLTADMN